MPTSARDKRLRAELAAELGWYPADLDDESVARHRDDAARKGQIGRQKIFDGILDRLETDAS